MKVVRFTRTVPPYNANEVAGFDDEKADRYVAQGIAVYHGPDAEEPDEPEEPEGDLPESEPDSPGEDEGDGRPSEGSDKEPEASEDEASEADGDSGTDEEAAPDAEEPEGDLPEDFPGRADLEKAGISTIAGVREVEDLTAISGIGTVTAAKIRKALEDGS